MYPTLYVQQTDFGDVPYNSWGLMITLAFLCATVIAHPRAIAVGIPPTRMVSVYLVSIFFGLAGARLLHFTMATPEVFFADPMVYFRVWQGGFAFYGGLILAAVTAISYALWVRIDPWKLSDALAPVIMLGLSIGRIGCFLAGCCHGQEAVLPPDATPLLADTFTGGQIWVFPHTPFVLALMRNGVGHTDVVFYPTQLWETLAAFSIFAVTSWMWHRRRFDGQVIGAMLVLYSIWRPINESMRGDEVRGVGYFGSLTTSQVVSIPVAMIGVLVLVVGFFRGFKPESPWVPEDDTAGSAPQL